MEVPDVRCGCAHSSRSSTGPEPSDVSRLVPAELGGITPIFYAFSERENSSTSWRRSPAAYALHVQPVGGLKEDLPAGWTERARTVVADVRSRMDRFDDSCSATRSSVAARAVWASSHRGPCTRTG
ncbi:hypothetical protein E4K10_23475 [Streptomyces sp. T1317-0309]|nr:hypothetical protein E4K10_23475 [Streptomyces sp. T1317-0309]